MPRMPETAKQAVARYVVVGSKAKILGPLPEKVTFCKAADLKTCVADIGGRTVFVSCAGASTDALLRARLGAHTERRFDQLLTMKPARSGSIEALLGMFGKVIGVGGGRWLPLEELIKVITATDAVNRFIGGTADPRNKTLALVRGDGQTVVVPFSMFEATGNGVKPDFNALTFTDYGHTVGLGEYEASADAILYEIDETYRRKLNKERQKSDRSFGASLRRLRLQKRLNRSDFAPLAAKTIARIERNEIDKPHGKSMDVIAQRLGVAVDQIETY
jgi:hypothetical protein